MDRSLSTFIWKHSKREQMVLLVVTVLTFPLLYATLELPKRIINDAIGADDLMVNAFGYELSRIQFLTLLCLGYLAAVLGSWPAQNAPQYDEGRYCGAIVAPIPL